MITFFYRNFQLFTKIGNLFCYLASDDRFEPYFNPKRRAVSPSLVGSPPIVTSVSSLSNNNGNNDNDDVDS